MSHMTNLAIALCAAALCSCSSSNAPATETAPPTGGGESSATSGDEGETSRYGDTIESVQARVAPSSQPGRRVMTILHAGQDRTFPLELAARRCYVVLGEVSVLDAANRGATPDLDLSLLDPAGAVVQQDRTDDSNPVLGGPDAQLCPTTAGTYTLRAVMERGEGFMAAQLFESAP